MERVPAGAPARAKCGLLVALLSLITLALSAARASAVLVQVEGTRTLSYQPLRGAKLATEGEQLTKPFDAFFSNLDYNGGPVMPANTNYTFYWDPAGAPAYPAEYQSGINEYLENLAHDSGGHENTDSVSTQYNDAAGAFAAYNSHFAGAIIDTDPYPANGCTRAKICLTDAQLQAELKSYITAHSLPHDLSHEYFMLTPPGVESCFEASGQECSADSTKPVYCAYHGNIPLTGGEIIYADDPYVTGIEGCDDGNHPNNKPSDGALEGGLSHEHNESITDPEPNDAWTDIGGSGGEEADKCEGSMGSPLGTAPDGARYNQIINGHFYWYQELWSNQGHECLQRLTFSGAEPTATFTSTQEAGEKMSFNATGSTASGGVAHYNWQFNDGPGLANPAESTTPTITHTFPAQGTYLVALTVFAANGTSIGTSQSVTVGTPPGAAVKKISPKTGPAAGGTSVQITGADFTGATAVKFGTTSASFTVNSATSITATAPAGTSATVNVTVTTPQGTSALVKGDQFKYGPATVTAVNPNSGSTAGGTSVKITGSGFALGSATKFEFGKADASAVECTSDSACTAVSSKASKAGTVDVKANLGGKKSKKNAPGDSFTYN
jgi:PKD domain/IPT/TIG domain